MLASAHSPGAELSLATIPVSREEASDFGIMLTEQTDGSLRFVEKPKEATVLDAMNMVARFTRCHWTGEEEELFQASMGIYVFNRNVLVECLDNDFMDFGKHVIPAAIQTRDVTPTFSKAIGRTSERFALSSTRISI